MVKWDFIMFDVEFVKFVFLVFDLNLLDGFNIYCFIVDEFYLWKDCNFWGVMEILIGVCEQFLVFLILIVGWILDGIGKELFDDGCIILENYGFEENVFIMNYMLDDGDKFNDCICWIKVNFCFGVFVKEEDIECFCCKVECMVLEWVNFLIKCLNVWVNNVEVWLNLDKFYKCVDFNVCLEDFEGCDCIIGVDFVDYFDLIFVCYLFVNDNGMFNVFYENFLFNFVMDKVFE